MLCFLCGKKIGLLRSLFDQQYCCPEHRREARQASAKALRDEEEFEPWTVSKSRDKKIGPKSSASAGQTASIFAFVTVGLLLVAALMLPSPSGGGGDAARPGVSLNPTVTKGFLARTSDGIAEWVRSASPITLHHDFSAGLADWTNIALKSTIDDPKDWGTSATRPKLAGSLRLWSKSTLLQNYQMEFQGQIENKSLSWAFRATDAANYYATKVTITRPGPLPNASLVRYVVMNGREWDRVQLPLPITLDRGENYRVRVSVQDDRFVTYLNGRVISSWTDKRLNHGGVGFLSEPEDPQKVAWISVSERDSLLGRLLAEFSLFKLPSLP